MEEWRRGRKDAEHEVTERKSAVKLVVFLLRKYRTEGRKVVLTTIRMFNKRRPPSDAKTSTIREEVAWKKSAVVGAVEDLLEEVDTTRQDLGVLLAACTLHGEGGLRQERWSCIPPTEGVLYCFIFLCLRVLCDRVVCVLV